LLNATSNSTGLCFKITDIVEGMVYDTSKQIPNPKDENVRVFSSVHLGQKPGSIKGDPGNPEKKTYDKR
jgi:hypothetical protein